MNRDKQRLARGLARVRNVPLDCDFHALRSDAVEALLTVADTIGYRKPRNANGSRARYFYAYLQRAAQSDKR